MTIDWDDLKPQWEKWTPDKERKLNCCVSPEGDWFNVPFAKHEAFARDYIQQHRIELTEKEHEYVEPKYLDILVHRLGWLSIQSTMALGVIIQGANNMTYAQYTVLYEVFGNAPLQRGWTVQRYWEASRKYE